MTPPALALVLFEQAQVLQADQHVAGDHAADAEVAGQLDLVDPVATEDREVHCFAADGRLLGKIRLPEAAATVCFGGARRNRLFICATSSLYAVDLNTRGAGR